MKPRVASPFALVPRIKGGLTFEKSFTISVIDVNENPPIVTTTSFVTSGTLAVGATSLTVTFSKPVLGADQASNYELRRAGTDGLLGHADDQLIAIASASVSGNTATLNFAGLPEDVYRLFVKDTITDVATNSLDGDANGTPGGVWRRDFVVGALTTSLNSSNGFTFDPEFGGFGAGQVVQGPNGAFDGVNRLMVAGAALNANISTIPGATLTTLSPSVVSLTTLQGGSNASGWTNLTLPNFTSTFTTQGSVQELSSQIFMLAASINASVLTLRFVVDGVPQPSIYAYLEAGRPASIELKSIVSGLAPGSHSVIVQANTGNYQPSETIGSIVYLAPSTIRILDVVNHPSAVLLNAGMTLATAITAVSGISLSREITVPSAGYRDFSRTVDGFFNPTTRPVTTSVRIVGNVGSDAATTVFATSDGDIIVEPTDWWFGTDDGDGNGTPAIIHLLHGPGGLIPASVNVFEDNVEWTYNLTVGAGETKRLAQFTVLGTTRAQAIAAANALVTNTGFGGEAATFLTAGELSSLANFQFNTAPIADAGGPYSGLEGAGILLDASGSSDGQDAQSALQFEWDLNYDGIMLEVDAVGIQPSVVFADNFTGTIALRVTDSHGLSSMDLASAVITNANPTPSIVSISTTLVEGTQIDVTGSATDPAGSNDMLTFTYAVFKNGSATAFASVSDTDLTAFSFTPDENGSYQILLTVSDEDGGEGTTTANIIVTDDDEIPPVIILGGSIGNETDDQSQSFSWSISDASGLASSEVSMTRNGGGMYGGILPSGSFNFDAYGPGTYVITVTATDADNDRGGDSLTTIVTRTPIVSDDDESPPILALGGSSGTQTDAETQVFSWNISDASGLAASEVLMHQNGGGMYGGILPSGSFNFDAYGLGTFVMSVTATDADNDWNIGGIDSLSAAATRTVTVIDDDDDGPTAVITSTASGGVTGSAAVESHGLVNALHWSVSDSSSISSVLVTILQNGVTTVAQFVGQSSGSYNLDALGPGVYDIEIHAVDDDNDRGVNDRASSVTSGRIIVTNATPLADDDFASVTEDTVFQATGNILNNDSDLNPGTTLSVAAPGTYVGAYGTLQFSGDGSYTYNLNNGSPAVQSLGDGGMLSDVFDYVASDGMESSAATLIVTIHGKNEPPAAQNDVASVTEDTLPAATGNLLANDTDEENDTLSVQPVTSGGIYGFLMLGGDGSYSYTLFSDPFLSPVVQSLRAGQTVSDTFAYRASDGIALSNIARLTVTIHGTNDAPVALPVTGNVHEDGPSLIVTANFSDVDYGDTHSIAINTSGTAGSVINNGDGTFAYDPNGQFEHLSAGETATDTFTFTVDDGNGGSGTSTVTITITGRNDAPLSQDGTAAATEDGIVVSGQLVADDIDSDDDVTSLVYSLWSGPSEGTVTVNSDGSFSFDPRNDFQNLAMGETRNVSFTFQVMDRHNTLSNIATVVVTVTGSNDQPTITMLTSSGFDLAHLSDNGSVFLNGAFADIDTTDTHSVTVDWGDGSVAEIISPDQLADTFARGHDYETGGIFQIIVTVADNNGSLDTETTSAFVQGVGVVNGGAGDDSIWGGGGNDTINDLIGNNKIWSEGGNDVVTVGNGNNQIDVGSGNNMVTSGNGNNSIQANGGSDGGSDGNNVIVVGNGNNDIQTGDGNDAITTGNGNNEIHAVGGDYTINTGSGKDRIWTEGGNDTINAGDGDNEVRSSRGALMNNTVRSRPIRGA